MTEIDQELIQRIKKTYGPDCELVRRTEWSYAYNCGPNGCCTISRFMAEKGLTISAGYIREQWPHWDERQRLDFASNWWSKSDWTDDDTQILETIMADGDDQIWEMCAQAFLKHPDRDRIVRFLIDRVEHYSLPHEPVNYFQVLGMSKDSRAVPAMRPFYEQYKKAVDAEAIIGVPKQVFSGPIPYFAFLSTAGSLFEITGSSEYEQAIRKFFTHENEQVRYWAEYALGIEGPTTAKRNAEYKKNPP